MTSDPGREAAAREAEGEVPLGRWYAEGEWLAVDVGRHTCGTGQGGHYGAHERGCGLEPIALMRTEQDAQEVADAHNAVLAALPGPPDETDPLSVACPTCRSARQVPCRWESGYVSLHEVHAKRDRLADPMTPRGERERLARLLDPPGAAASSPAQAQSALPGQDGAPTTDRCRYCETPLTDDQQCRWGICEHCYDAGRAS